MKNSLKTLILIIFSLATSQAQLLNEPELLDKIVAKVDNYYILESELNAQYFQYVSQNQGQVPTRCQLLEGLVINKMMLAKAEIDSVIVEDLLVDSELDSRMAQMEAQYGNSINIVKAFGKSISDIKEEIKSNLKEQMTYNKMQGEIARSVKITPSEVKEFYETIPKDSLPYIPAEVEVSQIVRLARPTKAQKQVIIDRLLDIKRRVGNGEKFEDLAKIYSEDLGSGKRGGDLGWSKRGQMVAPFEAAALKLKEGEMSDIVESEFGFHLIKSAGIRGQEYRASHILIRPDYQNLDTKPAVAFLDSIKILMQKVDTLSFERAATLYSEDEETKANAGYLRNPSNFSNRLVFDKTMDPVLYFALDSMEVGQVSAPMNYRTADGKTGMRIIKLKEKYPPHFADLQKDYEKLAETALQRKQNKEMDQWFAKAKDEVFIWVENEFSQCHIMEDL